MIITQEPRIQKEILVGIGISLELLVLSQFAAILWFKTRFDSFVA